MNRARAPHLPWGGSEQCLQFVDILHARIDGALEFLAHVSSSCAMSPQSAAAKVVVVCGAIAHQAHGQEVTVSVRPGCRNHSSASA
ncbi:MAG: hypothetical protein H6993_11440 [Pseudomonadales bacterium]|nr:hypothetical protein [Pseudomonadales bacterium]